MTQSSDRIFLQLGAGAGDLDQRAANRDGFAEHVKNTASATDLVVLVEPNPANLKKLQISYQTMTNVRIEPVAVLPYETGGCRYHIVVRTRGRSTLSNHVSELRSSRRALSCEPTSLYVGTRCCHQRLPQRITG